MRQRSGVCPPPLPAFAIAIPWRNSCQHQWSLADFSVQATGVGLFHFPLPSLYREAEAITMKTHSSTSPNNNTRLAVLLAKVDAVLKLSNSSRGTFGELRAARAAFDEAPSGETGAYGSALDGTKTDGPAGGEAGERPTIIPE